MKKIASLLAVVALAACSDSENVAEANEEDVLAMEELSSSQLELSSATEPASSPSSGASSSSLSSASSSSSDTLDVKIEILSPSSSSVLFVEEQIELIGVLEDYVPCGSASPSSKLNKSPYEMLVSARAEKLVSGGASAEDAEKAAKQDLFRALGIDTLLNRSSFSNFSINDAINYIIIKTGNFGNDVVDPFAESGTLPLADFCEIWRDVPWETRGQKTMESWAETVGIRGCVYAPEAIEEPYLIFNNFYRKCVGLPYCDEKMLGVIKHASLQGVIADTSYVCKENGWDILANYDNDVKDMPCDSVGKMFKSESVEEQFYVCKEDGWNTTTKMAYETRDISCDKPLKLVVSPTVDTLFYLCKDSEWKIANQLEIETNDIPCDRVGKIVKSQKQTCSYCSTPYYICRDTGWDIATSREADIGENVCDAEGKNIHGIVNKEMMYVCYNNKWTDFYDAPCDSNNKRTLDPREYDNNRLICYDGTWRTMTEWTCEYPKEYYFNPAVNYGTLMDSRDGNVYRTVEVFGKTWMAENMRFATDDATQSVVVEEGCEIAGRYYSIDVAPTVCPTGWRLPDSADFKSFYTPEYDRLSGYEQASYLGQFMSEIGEHCAGFACNVFGTTFIPVGSYESGTRNGNGMTYYWVYGDYVTKDILHISFNDKFISYYRPKTGTFLPVRCIKE